MIRELLIVITSTFSLAVYYITIGPVISVLDGVMRMNAIDAPNKVGGSLISWLPYLFFIVAPGLVVVAVAVYALARAGKTEGVAQERRRR